MPQLQAQTTIAIRRIKPPAPSTPLKSTIGVRKEQHMWQSRVEIEGYSIAYFDRIAAFEAPYR